MGDHMISQNTMAFFEEIEDFLFILDENGSILKTNKYVIDNLGYSIDDLTGMNVILLHPPERRQQALEVVKGMVEGTISKCPIPLFTKSGNLIPVETRVFPGEWNGKKVLFGISKDLSQSSIANERFLKLFRENPSLVAISNLETGEYVDVNETFVKTLGYARSEILGKTSSDLHIFNNITNRDDTIKELHSKGSVRHKEVLITDKYGNTHFGLFSADILEFGNSKYLLTTMDDLTERRQAENVLKESEQRYSAIVNSAPEIVIIHVMGRIVFVNNAGIKISGYNEEELIDNNVFNFLTDKSKKIAEENLARRVNGESFDDYELEFIKKSGDIMYIIVKTNIITYKNEFAILAVLIDITEKKKADKMLSESEARFRSIFENAAVAMFIADFKSNAIKRNKVFEEITGYSSEELKTMSFMDFTHPDDLPLELGLNKELVENKRDNYNINKRYISKKGEIVWVESYVSAVRDENGKTQLLVGVINNITKRKSLEEILQIRSLVLENSPVSVVVTNTNGKIEYVNPKFIETTGYTFEEAKSKNIMQLEAGNQSPEFYKELWATITSGKEWKGELCNRKKNGELFWEEATIAPMKSSDNQITHFVAVKQNITDQKLINEELSRREKLISAIAISIKELLENSNYLEAAQKCFKIIGESVNLDRISLFQNLIDEESNKSVQLLLEWKSGNISLAKNRILTISFDDQKNGLELLLKGEPFFGIVSQIKDNQLRLLLENQKIKSIAALPIFVKGSFWGFVGFEDCSTEREWNESASSALAAFVSSLQKAIERRLLEEELHLSHTAAEAANKAKSIFLANMSHEIRTPMNAILGFSDLLKAQITDPIHKNYIESIGASSKTLLQIINDILDLSKIEADKMEIRPETIDAHSIFRELDFIFEKNALDKNIGFMVEVASEVPQYMVLDELRVRQVLLNIIGNAIKFTHKGSVVLSVTFQKTADEYGDLIMKVTDTGIGIPKESQEKIFETFQQQDDQDTRKYGGTGLGLAISNRLVKLMNGKIILESKPNVGSEFSIVLKQVKVQTNANSITPEKIVDIRSYSFERAKVLVVDDIQVNRNLIKGYLKDFDLEIIEAIDGAQAIIKALELKPDIILMDLRMPGMDGYKATRKIKADKSTSHVPVIAVTASIFIVDDKLITQKGFNGYLRKPFRQHEIVEQLARFLKHVRVKNTTFNEAPDNLAIEFISIEKVINLIDVINSEASPIWETLQSRQPMKEVRQFVEKLQKIGNEYDIRVITNYAIELNQYVANFDIDSMRRQLAQFPSLVDKLSKIATK